MNRSTNTGSIFRIAIGGHAIITWFMGVLEPRSLTHVIGATNEGALILWLLLILGSCLVIDTVINDFLPEGYHWKLAVQQRHFLLTGLAFCYLSSLYVAFHNLHSTGLLLYYLWNAATIMYYAFIDAHYRAKEATCVILTSNI